MGMGDSPFDLTASHLFHTQKVDSFIVAINILANFL